MPRSPQQDSSPMGQLGSRSRSPSPLRGITLASCVRRPASAAGATASRQHEHCKLEEANGRFSTFLTDLEQQKQQRRAAEAARLQALTDALSKLERSVEEEAKRRADADAQIKARAFEELRAASDKAASKYEELTGAYSGTLEGLARGLQDLQAAVKEEREQRRREAERVAASLVGKVGEAAAAVNQERVARTEAQARCARQVAADVLRLQESLSSGAGGRVGEAAQLRAEVLEVVGTRDGAAERFKAVVSSELAALRGDVEAEAAERSAGDDAIVGAVNDYTAALQDGLRLAMAS